MKIHATFPCVVILSLMVLSCGTPGIKRSISPIENRYIEAPGQGPALVRSAACDIYLEHVSLDKWKKVLAFAGYSKRNPLVSSYRLPPFEFFQVTIRNTSDLPVTVEECYIKWAGGTVKSLSVEELGARCSGRAYGIYDFSGIYSRRRLTGRSFSISEIDYRKDTIGLSLPFVPAGDSALFIRAFDWIPSEAEFFEVVLVIRAGTRVSPITMSMNWQEFRARGKDFREPRKKKEDEYEDLYY
jgi:hypothetical protein